MSKSDYSLCFQNIEIRRMPGFEARGFTVTELAEGVNVIFGPNASGKSTLARALQTMIWPNSLPDTAQSILKAQWKVGAELWDLELSAGRAHYRNHHNERASAPLFPPAEQRDRYHIYLHDLLHDANTPLAEAIMRESVGGYDIVRAREKLSFKQPSARVLQTAKLVQNAREELQKAQREQQDLVERQRELVRLKEQARSIAREGLVLPLLELACHVIQAREEHQSCTEQMRLYPEVLAKIVGNEVQKLRAINDTHDDYAQQLKHAQQRLALLDAQLNAETRFFAQNEPQLALKVMQSQLETLLHSERERFELESELDAARALKQEEEKRLQNTEVSELSALNDADISKLAEWMRLAHDIQAQASALSHLEFLLDRSDTSQTPEGVEVVSNIETLEILRDGMGCLQKWLDAARVKNAQNELKSHALYAYLIFLSAFVVAACALGLAVLLNLLWLALLVISITLVVLGLKIRSQPDDNDNDAAERIYQQEYAKLGLPEISSWQIEHVEKQLGALREQFVQAKLDALKASSWENLQSERDKLQREREQLHLKSRDFMARTGLDISLEEPHYIWLLQRVSSWQNALNRVCELEAKHKAAQRAHLECLDAINHELKRFSCSTVDNTHQAKAQIEAFRDALEAHQKVERDHEQATQHNQMLQRGVDDARAQRTQLFEWLEISEHDAGQLEYWCAQKEEYNHAIRALDSSARSFELATEKLTRAIEESSVADHVGSPDELLSQGQDALEQRIETLRSNVESLQEITKDIATLESEIKLAMNSSAIEEAQARYTHSLEQLERERQQHQSMAMGWVLSEYVREKTRDSDKPDVFHRAREIFSTITRGCYRLEFDDGSSPAFRARDCIKDVLLELDELSSGTRVQLLLAVRVAFVEHQEQGIKLPLVLDETMANSDETRMEAMIEALIELASQGRQIFYFTAREDEVHKWQSALSQVNMPSYRVIKLHRLNDTTTAQTMEHTAPFAQAYVMRAHNVPAPENLDYEEYGTRLQVPPVDFREPVEATHLWYMLDDVQELYKFLTWNVFKLGQLLQLHELGAVHQMELRNTSTIQRVIERTHILRALAEAYSIGRGLSVDRVVLAQSGAVSDTFIDALDALCRTHRGDATKILNALEAGEVARFRQDKIDALREYFLAHDYLDAREPLDADAMWQHILVALARTNTSLPPDAVRAFITRILQRVPKEHASSTCEEVV